MGQTLCSSSDDKSEFEINMHSCLQALKKEQTYKSIGNYLSQIEKNLGVNKSSNDLVVSVINIGLKDMQKDEQIFLKYNCLHVLATMMCKKSNILIDLIKIQDNIFGKQEWAHEHNKNNQNLIESEFNQIINEQSPLQKFKYLKEIIHNGDNSRSRKQIVEQFKKQVEYADMKIQNQLYFQIRVLFSNIQFIQDFYPSSLIVQDEISLLADLLQGIIELKQPKFNFHIREQQEYRQTSSYLLFVHKSQNKFLGYLKVLIWQFINKLKNLNGKFNIPYDKNDVSLNSSLFKLKTNEVLNIDYYKLSLNYKQNVEIEEWPCQMEIRKTFFLLNRQSIIVEGIKIWKSVYESYTNPLLKVDCIKYIVDLTTHSIYTFYGYLYTNKGVDKQLLFIICQGISEVLIFPKTNQTPFHTPTQTFNYLYQLSKLQDEVDCSAEILMEKNNEWRLAQYYKKFNNQQFNNELLKQFEFNNTYLNFSYMNKEQMSSYNWLYRYVKNMVNPKEEEQLQI